ncbi:MAG: outer membrane protein assembly factor BamA [Spirochaetales bacterium]|nr:outer membrane protein assembly factor BamA [Spirochaetales bacterium]
MFKKKFLVLILVILTIAVPLFADDWYIGKKISNFEYTNLHNVTARKLTSLLSDFKGKTLDDNVLSEIDKILYAENWMNYYILDPIQEENSNNVILRFEIHEQPMIKEIKFSGNKILKDRILFEEQSLNVGDFFSPGIVNSQATVLTEFYISRGFVYAEVTAEYEENEELSQIIVTFNCTENERYKVGEIIFEGIENLTDKQLLKVMETKAKGLFKSGYYVESTINNDRRAIIDYYKENGFIDAQIEKVELFNITTPDDDSTMLQVIIHINEGAQWRMGKISFEGNKVFSDEEIQNTIYIQEGNSNNALQVQRQVQEIASLYYNNGYISTNVSDITTRNEDTHTIDHKFVIQESNKSYIEKILITGLKKTKEKVFARELEVKEGDVFSQAKLQKSFQNLMNTGIVEDVKTGLYRGDTDDGVVLELAIQEGNQMEVQFGATFGGNVDGFPISGFVQWADKNLLGTGRDLSIGTNISPDAQSLTISLSDDWVGDKRWNNGITLNLEKNNRKGQLQKAPGSNYYDGRDDEHETFPLGYYSWQAWDDSDNKYPDDSYLMNYDFYRVSIGYNTGYTFMFDKGSLKLGSGLSIGWNHAKYDSNYDPYEYIIKRYAEKWQMSNKLSFSISWDARDLRRNTSKGYVLSTGWTYAGGFLGGLSNYNKLSFSASGFKTVKTLENSEGEKKNLVLSATSQVSFMLPQYWDYSADGGFGWHDAYMGATKYEMLYLDGMNIGRGFSTVYDQSIMWHNQIELSYPLISNVLSWEIYTSATALTKRIDSEYDPSWYFSAGAGLKLSIPGFPLGLYLCKNATKIAGEDFTFKSGPIFQNSGNSNSGLRLVLAITTSLY